MDGPTLSGATRHCPRCATEIAVEAQMCPACRFVWPDSPLGQEMERRAARRTWLITAVVCIVLVIAASWFLIDTFQNSERKACEQLHGPDSPEC